VSPCESLCSLFSFALTAWQVSDSSCCFSVEDGEAAAGGAQLAIDRLAQGVVHLFSAFAVFTVDACGPSFRKQDRGGASSGGGSAAVTRVSLICCFSSDSVFLSHAANVCLTVSHS
jgi:hypothetical protein